MRIGKLFIDTNLWWRRPKERIRNKEVLQSVCVCVAVWEKGEPNWISATLSHSCPNLIRQHCVVCAFQTVFNLPINKMRFCFIHLSGYVIVLCGRMCVSQH